MITIKSLAEEVGVSKVAVNKWISKNGFSSRLEKVGNRYEVPDDIADAVRGAYMARREPKRTEPINTSSTAEKPLTDDVMALLDVLRGQLEQKDREINRLYEQVENLQAVNSDLTKAIRELNVIQYHQLAEPEKVEEPIEKVENALDLKEKPIKKSLWQRIKGAL